MFKSSRGFGPEGDERAQIKARPGIDESDDEEDSFEDGVDEIFIDLEKLLEIHGSVRIRIPPQASSTESSSEEGTRELVVSKGDQAGGIVF
jgi:hypothetical protein